MQLLQADTSSRPGASGRRTTISRARTRPGGCQRQAPPADHQGHPLRELCRLLPAEGDGEQELELDRVHQHLEPERVQRQRPLLALLAPVAAPRHILLSIRAAESERGRGADPEAGSGDELDGAHACHSNQVEHLPPLGDATRKTKVDRHHDQVPLPAAEQEPGRQLLVGTWRRSLEHVQVVGKLPPDGEEADGHERGPALSSRGGRLHSSRSSVNQ